MLYKLVVELPTRFEKYAHVKLDHLPKGRGENKRNISRNMMFHGIWHEAKLHALLL